MKVLEFKQRKVNLLFAINNRINPAWRLWSDFSIHPMSKYRAKRAMLPGSDSELKALVKELADQFKQTGSL